MPRRHGDSVGGVAVQENTPRRGRLSARVALRQERADDAGEHVAGAAGREPGIAERLIHGRPSGAAVIVRAPFSTTTAS